MTNQKKKEEKEEKKFSPHTHTNSRKEIQFLAATSNDVT